MKKSLTLWMLLLCALIAGSSSAWATSPVSINTTKANWGNDFATTKVLDENISLTTTGGGGIRTDELRFKNNTSLLVQGSTGVTITNIAFTYTSDAAATGEFTPNVGSWTTEATAWSGSVNSVTFSATSQFDVASVTVTYTTSGGGSEGGGSATAPTLSSSTPANNATDVATSGNITVTFSENVTIKDATKFTLSGGAGTLNTGSATVEEATVTIPYSGLANGTVYTLSTSAGAVTGSEADNAALSDIVFTTALGAVTSKVWAKDDAAWDDYTGDATIIDNLQVGKSVTGKSAAKTFADGNTYTKAWSLGGSSSSNNEKNLHFKVAGKCKISVYAYPEGTGNRTMYIRKGAYNGTEIASKANGGTTDHFILEGNYRTDEEADIYIVAGSNWSVYAVKVEPLVETGTSANDAVTDGVYYATTDNATGISGSGADEVTFAGIGTLAGSNMQSGSTTFTIDGESYKSFKAARGSTHVLTPADGVTIKSVTLYASAIEDNTNVVIGTEGSETTVETTGATPTAVTLSTNGEGKYWFSVTSSSTTYQALVVLKITYDRSASIDVTVSSAGYATLYYGTDVTIPDGVEAYYGKLNGSSFSMTKIEDGKIPANTGVILKAAQGTYSFTESTDATAISADDNDLTGTTTGTTVAANSVYTLGQNSEGVVGLRLYTGTSIRAYSAYMETSAGANFYSLDMDDASNETTSIKAIDNGHLTMDKNAPMYNLAGQKVSDSYKGIVVSNGKKYVRK